jgi:hypothetical protein
MNERIRALWKQAGGHYNSGNQHTWPEYTIDDPEKFALLIVEECAEQIIAKGTDWVDFAPSQTGVRPEYWNMAQQIKQHLGVKE